ncbi:hypothetical protein NKG94_15340 [Micromonospora sp. M12]
MNRISRFTFNPSTLVLDPASETKLIEWPTERRLCCHSAGSMTWDSNENLYFAVGDNTNSGGDSAGMAPIDERTSRDAQYDAQRTSGNTNDLRGKINRIHPEDNGTYTVPTGNLFAAGTSGTRPEVYVMGCVTRTACGWTARAATRSTGARSVRTPGRRSPTGAGGVRRVEPGHRTGQPRMAVLRRPQRRLQRLGLRHQLAARLVPVRWQHRPGEQLAPQHRPPATPADPGRAGLGAARRQPGLASTGQPGRLRLAQPRRGLPLRPQPRLGREVAAVLRQQAGHHRVLP